LLNSKIYVLSNNGGSGGTVQAFAHEGSNVPMPIYQGRTKVLIGGIQAAVDFVTEQGKDKTPIAGTFSFKNTEYKISGEVEASKGKVNVTIAPALPDNTLIEVECFVNFEQAITVPFWPSIDTSFRTYRIESTTIQGTINFNYLSDSQARNEAQYDIQAQSYTLIRKHLANEEYRKCLARAKTIGETYNFTSVDLNLTGRTLELKLEEAFQDISVTLQRASSKMVERTQDYGISVLHVNTDFAALLSQLPSTRYAKSPPPTTPTNIYYDGLLFGRYHVYVDPCAENTVGRVICTGRSSQVALSPFLAGTVQAPQMSPKTEKEGGRQFVNYTGRIISGVNPHLQAAMGCAVIEFTGLV
jgi:hypothetical protein